MNWIRTNMHNWMKFEARNRTWVNQWTSPVQYSDRAIIPLYNTGHAYNYQSISLAVLNGLASIKWPLFSYLCESNGEI